MPNLRSLHHYASIMISSSGIGIVLLSCQQICLLASQSILSLLPGCTECSLGCSGIASSLLCLNLNRSKSLLLNLLCPSISSQCLISLGSSFCLQLSLLVLPVLVDIQQHLVISLGTQGISTLPDLALAVGKLLCRFNLLRWRTLCSTDEIAKMHQEIAPLLHLGLPLRFLLQGFIGSYGFISITQSIEPWHEDRPVSITILLVISHDVIRLHLPQERVLLYLAVRPAPVYLNTLVRLHLGNFLGWLLGKRFLATIPCNTGRINSSTLSRFCCSGLNCCCNLRLHRIIIRKINNRSNGSSRTLRS